MKSILTSYSRLNTVPPTFVYAKEFLPVPSDSDYRRGFFVRYFVKRVNGDVIIEVNRENYESITKSLYESVDIRWEITGTKNDVYSNGKLQSSGVTEKNTKSIKIAEKTLTGITNKLINPTQFFRS